MTVEEPIIAATAPVANLKKRVGHIDNLPSTATKSSTTTGSSTVFSNSLNVAETYNSAISRSAYALSSLVFIYPTTGSLSAGYLGSHLEHWSKQGVTNIYGHAPTIAHMSTRSGALTAVKGALSSTSLANGGISVLTSAGGLYAMLPNLHRLRAPLTIHLSASGLDENLIARPDFAAVMHARGTGVAMLGSNSIQEAADIAFAAGLVASRLGRPVLHWFNEGDAEEVVTVRQMSPGKINEIMLAWSKTESSPIDLDGTVAVIEEALKAVGNHAAFEYYGAQNAEDIVVLLVGGSDSLVTAAKTRSLSKIGVLAVRVYRPWSQSKFLASLPASAKRIIVLEQTEEQTSVSGPLFADVAASFRSGEGPNPRVFAARSSNLQNLRAENLEQLFDFFESHSTSVNFIDIDSTEFNSSQVQQSSQSSQPSSVQAIFWDAASIIHVPTNTTVTAASVFASRGHALRARTATDFYRPAGPVTSTLLRYTRDPVPSITDIAFIAPSFDAVAETDYIGIHDIALTHEYDILASARGRTTILFAGPWRSDVDLETKLGNKFKQRAAQLEMRLFALDADSIASEFDLPKITARLPLEIAFLLLTAQKQQNETLVSELAAQHSEVTEEIMRECVAKVQASLIRLDTPPPWGILEPELTETPSFASSRGAEVTHTDSKAILDMNTNDSSVTHVRHWHLAAQTLLFPEVYGTKLALDPFSHEKTYLIRVIENRRLTSLNYDRNVFHIEFDTTNTDLRYEIGDALGVHGHNDTEEVLEFLAWYNLKPNDLVVLSNNEKGEGNDKVETRTILQLFQQNLDIFGRPSKRFYEALASFATDPAEREKLLWLISPEGAAEYKSRIEDTVTYNDLLREFTSAHPPVEQLANMITPIKPRHYSIASSQRMHPNAVHLLVVAVDWRTSKGELRFGQCTRYLAGLKLGTSVTVSIKPSVMKLPLLHTQPVIMAGLGTGMAPFRAFIQERAMYKAAGEEVGPMVLYFGSRHRADEYLYGEELEAYHADGLLTHMGLAFSRDQPKKIYIQHRMLEDGSMLHDALLRKDGHFYLCGPTWPVPDVKDAIVAAFRKYGGIETKVAHETIENLKEKERYVLEVY